MTPSPDPPQLSHFNAAGAPHMVDVADKPVTLRTATAEGFVQMRPETAEHIQNRKIAKGDVLEVARLAGIMATKQTANLIPLCHPLPIDGVAIDFEPLSEPTGFRIIARVRATARTGVEMEALTAVTAAALTLYDMCKSLDRAMQLGPFRLLKKTGGKSGHFQRPAQSLPPT